jgi:predicted transcriptional regulator of viral defense system
MRAVEALETLELLGSSQRGLVTAAQAKVAGVSRVDLARLVESGTLFRARHGVYVLPSAGVDPLQDLRAAWLSASAAGKVVVSGVSAAAVHGLGDLVPASHEFTAADRRQSAQPDVRFRRAELSEPDVTWVDGLAVTSVPRTVADLARASLDSSHLASVLSDAVDDPSVDVDELEHAVERYSRRYGAKSGRDLLAKAAPGYFAAAFRSAVGSSGDFTSSFRNQLLELLEQPDGFNELLRSLRERTAA